MSWCKPDIEKPDMLILCLIQTGSLIPVEHVQSRDKRVSHNPNKVPKGVNEREKGQDDRVNRQAKRSVG
jgi:hypothetical protein